MPVTVLADAGDVRDRGPGGEAAGTVDVDVPVRRCLRGAVVPGAGNCAIARGVAERGVPPVVRGQLVQPERGTRGVGGPLVLTGDREVGRQAVVRRVRADRDRARGRRQGDRQRQGDEQPDVLAERSHLGDIGRVPGDLRGHGAAGRARGDRTGEDRVAVRPGVGQEVGDCRLGCAGLLADPRCGSVRGRCSHHRAPNA